MTHRFKEHRPKDVMEDLNNARMLFKTHGDCYMLGGEIANYVVNSDGIVVTLVPIDEKYKKTKRKFRQFKGGDRELH